MANLIPFEQLTHHGAGGVLVLVAILIISIVILGKGADWLVEGAAQLAYRLGIGKIIVGATVVSLGTTSPEAAVSVMAAFEGKSGLALGNAIGSVICDTGLVFGVGCLLVRLPVDRFILNRHGWLQFCSGVLLVGLVLVSWLAWGTPIIISRWMGVGLLALLAAYMYISVHWAKRHPSPADDLPETLKGAGICLAMVVGGLLLVVVSARLLIGSVEQICIMMRVPDSVIAVTVVAFGTSLPELATAITSIRKGHPEILIGNVIGADILNVLFVIGASATAVPLPVPREVIWIFLPTMLLVLGLLRLFIATSGKSFSRWCGVPLLLIYVGFLAVVMVFAREYVS